MQLTIKETVIVHHNARAGMLVGIAQVREGDAVGRIRKEGCLVLVMNDAKGKEANALLTPDEARELGTMLVTGSYQAAGVLMPTVELKPAAAPPLVNGQ